MVFCGWLRCRAWTRPEKVIAQRADRGPDARR
jgi:hypothetical protein